MSYSLVKSFRGHLAYYRSQHLSKGCQYTHMIGIPLIALSLPMLLFSPTRAIRLCIIGWALQFWGHYGFERNSPVFLEVAHPFTAVSALVFCYQEWAKELKLWLRSLYFFAGFLR